jgi:hypothetical protein
MAMVAHAYEVPVLPVGPPEMKGIQLVAIGSDGSGSSGREGRHRDQQHELSDPWRCARWCQHAHSCDSVCPVRFVSIGFANPSIDSDNPRFWSGSDTVSLVRVEQTRVGVGLVCSDDWRHSFLTPMSRR